MLLIWFLLISIAFIYLFNCIVYFSVCRYIPGCKRPLLGAVLWPLMVLRCAVDKIYIKYVF